MKSLSPNILFCFSLSLVACDVTYAKEAVTDCQLEQNYVNELENDLHALEQNQGEALKKAEKFEKPLNTKTKHVHAALISEMKGRLQNVTGAHGQLELAPKKFSIKGLNGYEGNLAQKVRFSSNREGRAFITVTTKGTVNKEDGLAKSLEGLAIITETYDLKTWQKPKDGDVIAYGLSGKSRSYPRNKSSTIVYQSSKEEPDLFTIEHFKQLQNEDLESNKKMISLQKERMMKECSAEPAISPVKDPSHGEEAGQ